MEAGIKVEVIFKAKTKANLIDIAAEEVSLLTGS